MNSGRAIVFVDAGFLVMALAADAGKARRNEIAIDYAALTEAIHDLAEDATGRQVLRQTWYDGAEGARPRPEHRALAALPGVHVKLGWLVTTSQGPEQKAVDSLMVRDMVLAALRKTADDLVLIAGDRDLVPGVQEAAEQGMRIHLWGTSGSDQRFGQSEQLIALADRRLTLDLADLAPHVRERARPQPSAGPRVEAPAPELAPAEVALPDELTTEANIVPSARPVAEPARLGPPPLQSLSTPEQQDHDIAEDSADAPDAAALGERYGSRWATRASDAVRGRLRIVARRPGLPRRLDSDVLRYAESRGIGTRDDEQIRRDLRAGFWKGFDSVDLS